MDAPTYLPNFAPTYRCSACGAVVTELELHTVWHEHLETIFKLAQMGLNR